MTKTDTAVETPWLSVVTVAMNDVWAITKTARSVFEQTASGVEYVIVDGASKDGTDKLMSFWQREGLVARAVSEPDSGVYDAMNKGARLARGTYLLFLNAGDVFAGPQVLERVKPLLEDGKLDGVLGWGGLDGQIWAAWTESDAYLMTSLGFCHQALILRRSLLTETPFDDRRIKIDSDRIQLARSYAAGADIPILPEMLAVRDARPGLSADFDYTARSTGDTLASEYPNLSEEDGARLLAFRWRSEKPETLLALLSDPDPRTASHAARVALDTLFQRQGKWLKPEMLAEIEKRAFDILLAEPDGENEIRRLISAQLHRAGLMRKIREADARRDAAIAQFKDKEAKRIAEVRTKVLAPAKAAAAEKKTPAPADFVVSLTSFPARLKTAAYSIGTLFEQTCPPKEVQLWLGRDEVPSLDSLPKDLRALEERGLKIMFSDRTHHQYDKFMHNAETNADRPFVIVDDDVIYPPHSFEKLLEAHARHPDIVVANRCNLISLTSDGKPLPYKQWRRELRMPDPNFLLLPTGAGGVLYPPGFLSDPFVTNQPEILNQAPYADDMWLKACALIRSIPAYATELSRKNGWMLGYTPGMEEGALMSINVDRGLNDRQIENCLAMVERHNPGILKSMADGQSKSLETII